ncbi:hypothetical protein GAYE_SCF03G2228 [Galdieria yellowstonensis]|uniref:ATPase, vacuolar ER assembly factor, Vma12 n=1 Tax=Galdieria yellowstonensis TaxID=3028027 RepID=A0AAV9IAR4_9RHOD|nr:hypothetical protein GAYE_SCF03G2228 [Galdieria yellowstonensis]
MVQLQLSSRHQTQVRYVVESYLRENPKQKHLLDSLKEDTISHQNLYEITRLAPKDALPPFWSLVASSTWKLPPPKCPYDNYQRPAILDKRLEALRERHERKQYRELIQDLPSLAPSEPSTSASFKSFREQLTLGLQVLTSMATGFVVGYYVAWKLTAKQTVALIWGLLTLIFAMFVDVILIITGMLAKDMLIAKTNKKEKLS